MKKQTTKGLYLRPLFPHIYIFPYRYAIADSYKRESVISPLGAFGVHNLCTMIDIA